MFREVARSIMPISLPLLRKCRGRFLTRSQTQYWRRSWLTFLCFDFLDSICWCFASLAGSSCSRTVIQLQSGAFSLFFFLKSIDLLKQMIINLKKKYPDAFYYKMHWPFPGPCLPHAKHWAKIGPKAAAADGNPTPPLIGLAWFFFIRGKIDCTQKQKKARKNKKIKKVPWLDE